MAHLTRPDPPGLSRVVTRREALAAGMTDDEIRHRVRAGRWVALVRGQYLRGDLDVEEPFEQARMRHALEALSTARRISGAVVAYGSAATVHQMSLASGVPARRELVVPPGFWNGIRSGTRVRLAQLTDADIVHCGGIPVSSPARTWVDISRTSTLADALSAGDSALRRGLSSAAQLSEAIERQSGARGLRGAQRALPLLSPLRENPLESRSFAWFVERGLPLPECQVEFRDAGRSYRVDFLWRAARLIGEADGRWKYHTPEDVYAEKRREDWLRDQGHSMVRWGWHDLGDRLYRQLFRLLSAA